MGFAKLAASFLRSPGPGLTMMPKDGRGIGLELIYRILYLSWIKRWKYSADWGGREWKTKKIEQVAKSKDSLVYWHDPGIYCIIYCIYCNILARRPWPWSGIFEHQKLCFGQQ